MSKDPGQLGVWLRRELTARGYDLQRGGQSRFARETGLHVSIISRVLNEDRGVEVDALRRMGKALGYSLGEMLIFAGVAEPDELPAAERPSPTGPREPAGTEPAAAADRSKSERWSPEAEAGALDSLRALQQILLAQQEKLDEQQRAINDLSLKLDHLLRDQKEA